MAAEVRVFARGVQFLVQEQQESGRYDIIGIATVARDGYVDVDPFSEDRREKMTEALLDRGFVEWTRVSDEDSELYGTTKLRDHLEPALDAMPDGWQAWAP